MIHVYWIHYGNNRKYKFLYIADNENTGEHMVVYQDVESTNIYVRPAVEFFGSVTVDGITQNRFRSVKVTNESV